MRLVFCGTPQFAVPTLSALLAEGYALQWVLTNPDRPSGRGHQTQAPPVKRFALEHGLVAFQPPRLNDPFTERLVLSLQPDAIIVVAYGHLIPAWMIELPRLGCINLHASLLPAYRGAAPIQWAIARGERTTGLTTLKIDAGLDTGDILMQREVEIAEGERADSLAERMSRLGAELMVETLKGLEAGTVAARPQDDARATLAPRLHKEDGRIDWSLEARQIEWRVRGLVPWPGAHTSFRGHNFHVWSTTVAPERLRNGPEPGTLVARDGRFQVVCGAGTLLELAEVQLEGRRRMAARDFFNGFPPKPGEKLGT